MSTSLLLPSVPSRSIELINSLEQHSTYPKIYWKSRERELAAVGALQIVRELPMEKELFFGGMAFASEGRRDPCWQAFPPTYFFRPEEILFGKASSSVQPGAPRLLARKDSPSLAEWENEVHLALQAIEREEFEKVVLARKTTLTFDDKINPFALLQQLSNRTVFLLQLDPQTTFLGATPETLYRRKERELFTHAVAGTRARGKTREEDFLLKEELLTSNKERREFECVRREIFKRLTLLSQTVAQGQIELLLTDHLQHLSMNFFSTLRPGIFDAKILRALHPTPATGGLPQKEARAFLQAHEPFDRGWYAGPIGWVSDLETDFAVGIRSALIIQNEMHLFAGTGIVRGSRFEKEWEELEHKIQPFIHLVRADQ